MQNSDFVTWILDQIKADLGKKSFFVKPKWFEKVTPGHLKNPHTL